ncbi:TetR/AcrR family transcriptional regulator [Williamsia muralis]|uniref:TetR/AcrR family transcriptional regulator n=1 Tax=Williamsia marianensis TaxID=85044 RepID=UPI0037F9B5E8
MRPSKRTDILNATLRVIDNNGVTAVTFDSVAEEAGLSKGGLLYHFPSREALLKALHEHLAAQWESALIDAAGKPADKATATERSAAYAQVATQSATRAELLLILETANEPDMSAPFDAVMTRWATPVPATDQLSPTELVEHITRLAADGLWLDGALSNPTLSRSARQQISEYLADLARLLPTTERE